MFDIDGTREAARQRALPQSPELPVCQRRLEDVCTPGYTGRKRGEIVRTRTTVLQAHSSQWLGTFGNPGNGEYRKELRRAVEMIGSYLKAHQFPDKHALLRLDGLYGTGAVLADLRGFAFVMRSKEYGLLDLPVVQARLHLPADQQFSRPESTLIRTLYDCPEVAVGSSGLCCRLVVATHPAGPTKKRIGVERDGLIYELFLTKLPQEAFTAADVVALYLHRGAFETTLSDEDMEQEPDRWCSHAACGQEVWQSVSQWVWNLRLELGHHLEPEPLRTTEFAPALSPAKEPTAPACGYAPAVVALPFKQGRFSGCDFALQPDGTLRCPAGQALFATEERRRLMGACGWCTQRVSATVETAGYANSVSGMAGTPRNHVGSVCCFIPSRLALLPCSGVTGAAGSTVEPVCNSYVTNELTCTWSLSINLALLRLHRSFLVQSGPISGSRGKSDSHTMRLPQRLVGVRSPSSGCRKALRPRWVY